MISIHLKLHDDDTDMIEVCQYTAKGSKVLYGVVHIDMVFHPVHTRILERLKSGDEVELSLVPVIS